MTLGRRIAPALLIAMLAGAALSSASVGYEYESATHAGTAGGPFVLSVDALGAALTGLFAVQLLLAYRFFAAKPARQFSAHRAFGWVVLGVMFAHATGAVIHSFTPPREPVPLWLVGVGVPIAAGLVIQVVTGYGQRRHRAWRWWHTAAISVAALLVVAHVVLGTVHAVTG